MKSIPIDKQAQGKELYDATGRGTPDVWDAVVTILGGAVVLPYILLN